MSHAAEIELPAVDMLLIKPSWWARAGAGTRGVSDGLCKPYREER